VRRPVALAAVLAAALLVAAGTATAARQRARGGLAAAVATVKRNGYTPDSTAGWLGQSGLNVLVATATRSGDGFNKRAFFFENGRFLGTDAAAPSRELQEVWSTSDTVALLYVLYRRNDPNCCPTGGGAIVRFHWNGRRLVALDRIPSANFAARLSR